ncbi:GNAT family N-acetyltransferase [Pseudomonas sp. 3A(2025)]
MAFIERLFAGSRLAEVSRCGWSTEQIAAFLSQQFHAQHTYYQAHYAEADFWIIEHEGQPIGRIYLFWGPSIVNLIDITLLPEYQGHGIGSALIDAQLRRADELGLRMNLYVEAFNPAKRLYDRLGFIQCGDTGVYLQMRREPMTHSRNVS